MEEYLKHEVLYRGFYESLSTSKFDFIIAFIMARRNLYKLIGYDFTFALENLKEKVLKEQNRKFDAPKRFE